MKDCWASLFTVCSCKCRQDGALAWAGVGYILHTHMLSRLICWSLPVAAAVLAYLLSGVASRLLRIAVHRPETSPDAVRFGLLGAAKIAPHGLLFPALMVESATVVAVAGVTVVACAL